MEIKNICIYFVVLPRKNIMKNFKIKLTDITNRTGKKFLFISGLPKMFFDFQITPVSFTFKYILGKERTVCEHYIPYNYETSTYSFLGELESMSDVDAQVITGPSVTNSPSSNKMLYFVAIDHYINTDLPIIILEKGILHKECENSCDCENCTCREDEDEDELNEEDELDDKNFIVTESQYSLAKSQYALSQDIIKRYEEQNKCEHKEVKKSGESSRCVKCNEYMDGWFCPSSPDHTCHYYSSGEKGNCYVVIRGGEKHRLKKSYDNSNEEEDWCIFCGHPEERK